MLTYEELIAFEKQLLTISQEDKNYDEKKAFVSILEIEKKKKEKKDKLTNVLSSAIDVPEIEIIEDEEEEVVDDGEPPSIQIADEITSILASSEAKPADTGEAKKTETEKSDEDEEDDIDDIDKIVDSGDFSGFFLPKALHTLWDDIKQAPQKQKRVTAAEITSRLQETLTDVEVAEIDLEKDLKEIQSFDLEQYERYIENKDVSFDEKQIEEIIFQEMEEESKKVDDVEAIIATSYSEEDIEVFVTNLKRYGIVLQRSVVEIVNSDNILAASTIFDAVLNSVSASSLQSSCEKILGYSIPEIEDNHIYSFQELSSKLTTTRDSVLRVSRKILRDILPKIAAVLVVSFLGYVWVVQPIRAWIYYSIGFTQLQEEKYEESEGNFRTASSIQSMQGFYFKYAEEYVQQRKYAEAESKYEQLLFGLDDSLRSYLVEQVKQRDVFKRIEINGSYTDLAQVVNYKREGFLQLISFVLEYTGDLEFAHALYDFWLFEQRTDTEFKLGKADVYIMLYDKYQDPFYLDSARDYYNIAAKEAGFSIDSLIRRVRWAVRQDDEEAQSFIYGTVIANNLPLLAPFKVQYGDVYAELVSYFLDNYKYEEIPRILGILEQETQLVNPILVRFLQAKYAYQTQQYDLAKLLLDENFSQHLAKYDANEEDLLRLVELRILQSELVLMSSDNTVQAERYLQEAQVLYEEKLVNVSRKEKQRLSRLYFLLSKIMLQRRELDKAFYFSERARQELYESPQFEYQYGSIEYLRGNWTVASQSFFKLLKEYAVGEEERKTLLFSMANTLYMKKNFEGALLYYQEVLDMYSEIYSEDSTVLLYDDDLDEFIANDVDHIVMIRNNIGVALFELYKQHGLNEQYLNQSLNELRIAQSVSDNRNRTEAVRKIYHELPALNLAVVLGTTEEYETQIFSSISEELPDLSRWTNALANF